MAEETPLDIFLEDLKSDDPKERQNACDKLAQLGDPAAIEALSKLWREEEDSKVKAAAEKALKKFASQEATPNRAQQGATVFLIITLLVLGALNVVLRLNSGDDNSVPQEADNPLANATASSLDDLLMRYQNDFAAPAFGDFAMLEGEWQAATDGTLPCTATFTRVDSIQVATADEELYPDLNLVTDLNIAIESLATLITEWDTICSVGGSYTPEQEATTLETLAEIRSQLESSIGAITDAQLNPQPTNTSSAPPTAEPTATPTITPTPAPTLNPSTLSEITQRASSARGAIERVSAMNENVLAGQVPAFGCTGTVSVREDYLEPPADVLEQFPELDAVVIYLNNDILAPARVVNETFTSNCNSSTLTEAIISDLTSQIETISANLDSLETLLADYE